VKNLLACLCLSVFTASSPAAVLLTENFNYTNGPLITVSGSNWQNISGTSNQLTVTNSRVSMNLTSTEDAHVFLSPPPSTDTVYAGFTLRFSTMPPGGGSYFALFKDTGASTGFRARVWALTNSAPGGKYRLGMSSTTGTLNVTNTTDLSTNVDYRAVVRVSNVTGAATLWVNPTAETDSSVTTAETPASSTITAFALRQPDTRGLVTIDDLVVGETFAEVVSTSPPPAVPQPIPAISVLTYNTHGNFVADWTTNSAQVQAIGRQVMYLDPDIITFQEIPMTNSGWAQMTHFVTAFRPGFYLATNSGNDGFIRSAILSRYPITRSQSWLDEADLNPFGYTNNANYFADRFTRDLFEAEIAVPNFPQHLHVFTAHLKSGTSSSDDAQKRAAEAGAVSNFFVNVFLPTNGTHPYLLTGDLNEDIAQPATGSEQPIQRLVNNATGLRLTSPRNPVSNSHRTHSFQSTNLLANRYDYILPGGLLYSNIASSMVFRTDLLTNPPPPLLTNDAVTASDHLPVMMWFANPYGTPFSLLSVESASNAVTLRWESVSNRVYGVEASSNLNSWSTLASNLTASGTNTVFATNFTPGQRFFRVFRQP
jgi:endonuclease/exonuclease/phosphatase family metal-dependent hydrolase